MLKKADIGVGLYLLAAVVFFIVPIPSILLDVMLAINISIALIILFNVLFAKEVLDMSFFPTLLLFTTIFRISLNVSSTRLILLTGDPGNVVTTFGSFVGGFDFLCLFRRAGCLFCGEMLVMSFHRSDVWLVGVLWSLVRLYSLFWY